MLALLITANDVNDCQNSTWSVTSRHVTTRLDILSRPCILA